MENLIWLLDNFIYGDISAKNDEDLRKALAARLELSIAGREYSSLLARHTALEARVKHMNVWAECDKCACLFIPGGKGSETTCATCIKEERDALVEAVKWERECEDVAHWRYEVWEMAEVGSGDCEIYTVADCIHRSARAEVDRLLQEEK